MTKSTKIFSGGCWKRWKRYPAARNSAVSRASARCGRRQASRTSIREKMCPQYLLRTDKMDYEIRPLDLKHATLLPVGTEGEFKIKDKNILLTMPEGGDRKTRSYEVVSMNPAPAPPSESVDSAQRSSDDRASSGDRSSSNEP